MNRAPKLSRKILLAAAVLTIAAPAAALTDLAIPGNDCFSNDSGFVFGSQFGPYLNVSNVASRNLFCPLPTISGATNILGLQVTVYERNDTDLVCSLMATDRFGFGGIGATGRADINTPAATTFSVVATPFPISNIPFVSMICSMPAKTFSGTSNLTSYLYEYE